MDQQPNLYSITLSLTPELAEGLHQLLLQIPMGVIEPVVISFRKQIDQQKADHVKSLTEVSPKVKAAPTVEERPRQSSDLRDDIIRDVLGHPVSLKQFILDNDSGSPQRVR